MRVWLTLAVLALLIAQCGSREEPARPVAAAPPLWAEYTIWAAEGDSMATCKFQFYTGPQKRQSLWLDTPAGVSIDGIALAGDSAGLIGAFYEYQAPVTAFAGAHAIRFNDPEGRPFVDSFLFTPFRLAAELPESVPARAQVLRLQGLPDDTQLRIVLTDTAFNGFSYNEVKRVRNGQVQIEGEALQQLKSGPVTLHLSTEDSRPLNSRLRGAVSVSYSVMRTFELRR